MLRDTSFRIVRVHVGMVVISGWMLLAWLVGIVAQRTNRTEQLWWTEMSKGATTYLYSFQYQKDTHKINFRWKSKIRINSLIAFYWKRWNNYINFLKLRNNNLISTSNIDNLCIFIVLIFEVTTSDC